LLTHQATLISKQPAFP